MDKFGSSWYAVIIALSYFVFFRHRTHFFLDKIFGLMLIFYSMWSMYNYTGGSLFKSIITGIVIFVVLHLYLKGYKKDEMNE